MGDTLRDVYFKSLQNDVMSMMRKADYHVKNSNDELAAFYLKNVLEKQPKHFWALQDLATMAEAQKLYGDAIAYYQQARKVSTSNETSTYADCGLANVMYALGNFELAEKLYQQSIKQSPSYVFAYTGLAQVYQSYNPPPIHKILSLYEKAFQLAPELEWVGELIDKYQVQTLGVRAPDKSEQAPINDQPSMYELFERGSWVELLGCGGMGGNLVHGYTRKKLVQKLQAIPKDAFADLEAYCLYIANELTPDIDFEEPFLGPKSELQTAVGFCYLALNYSFKPAAATYIHSIKLLMLLDKMQEAESLALKALLNYEKDPEVLLVAARVMKERKSYSAARLLYSELIHVTPKALNDKTLKDIVLVHEECNKSNAVKLKNIKEYLLYHPLINKELVIKLPDLENATELDSWLSEFYERLGHYSADLLFDIDRYNLLSGQKLQSIDEVVTDYFLKGWRKNISIHPAFDEKYVRGQLVAGKKMEPVPLLLLYLRYERELKLSPNILINNDMLHGVPSGKTGSPWLAYISGSWREMANISSYFDLELYLERGTYRQSDKSQPPLLHFFSKDSTSDCNRLFHAGFYSHQYQSLLKGKVPILHYLTEGAYLGCLPNPFCVLNFKSGKERIDYLKIN